jgi:hypothetical protein
MKCIYEVRYDEQWSTAEPSHWEKQSVRVCAEMDALVAVEWVKEHVLSQTRLDQNGMEERCSGFRLREVVLIAEAELYAQRDKPKM